MDLEGGPGLQVAESGAHQLAGVEGNFENAPVASPLCRLP